MPCATCKESFIGPCKTYLTKDGKQYHFPKCVKCHMCRQTLNDKRFIEFKSHIFHRECHYCRVCFERPIECYGYDSLNPFDLRTLTHKKCAPCERPGCTISQINRYRYWDNSDKTQKRYYHPHCAPCIRCNKFGDKKDRKIKIDDHTVIHWKCVHCTNLDCTRNGKPYRAVHLKDDTLWHFLCVKCEGCKTTKKSVPTRRIIVVDGKYYHSDCYPCAKCSSVKNNHHVFYNNNSGEYNHSYRNCPRKPNKRKHIDISQ